MEGIGSENRDGFSAYLIEVTSQPLATAYLHIREPRKPFPPHTTSRLEAADIARRGYC
jgi:hypothetical protein